MDLHGFQVALQSRARTNVPKFGIAHALSLVVSSFEHRPFLKSLRLCHVCQGLGALAGSRDPSPGGNGCPDPRDLPKQRHKRRRRHGDQVKELGRKSEGKSREKQRERKRESKREKESG